MSAAQRDSTHDPSFRYLVYGTEGRRVKKLSRTQSAAFHTIYGVPDYTISALRACVLLRIILTEPYREIAGWACVPMAWGGRQRAMETAQHRARLAKNQPAEMREFESPQPTTFKGV